MTHPATDLDATSETAIASWLQQTLGQLLQRDGASINRRSKFADVGLDSVTGLQLIGHMEQEFSRSYDPGVILSHPTVESLARFLARDVSRNK